mmetsp:Transcript_8267/g.20447  ORF Transcript_8267/g.20447 Transcript_8267/m.20447 type:complete len:234 (+) Transcript_8267:363-1064(+)
MVPGNLRTMGSMVQEEAAMDLIVTLYTEVARVPPFFIPFFKNVARLLCFSISSGYLGWSFRIANRWGESSLFGSSPLSSSGGFDWSALWSEYDTSVTYRRSASTRSLWEIIEAFRYSSFGNRAMATDRTSPSPRVAVRGKFLKRSARRHANELTASKSNQVDMPVPEICNDKRLEKDGAIPASGGMVGTSLSSMLSDSKTGRLANLLTWLFHWSKQHREQSNWRRFRKPLTSP